MNSSIHSKLTLLRAGFERYPDFTPAARASLAEGLFWVCDLLQEQIEKGDSPSKRYCLGYLGSVKEWANEMTKRELTQVDLKQAVSYLAKLTMCSDGSPGQEKF